MNKAKAYCRENVRIISRNEEYIVRTCAENDFDLKRITAVFDTYLPDKKYKDLKDYNWQDTETRKEKKERIQRKKQAFEKKKAEELRKR